MTFDEFCKREKADPFERDKLAWHLAMLRARALYEALRPQPKWQRRKEK